MKKRIPVTEKLIEEQGASRMRVISGTCRGRKLATLKGMSIRPTSDRVRESIFNIIGQTVCQADILDLFAGTGAFGIECLSRGGKRAVFVDIARTSCSVIRQNTELCGFKENSLILQCDVSGNSFSSVIASSAFDIVFMDPPYEKGFVGKVLESSFPLNCLRNKQAGGESDSLVIVEHSVREKIPESLEKLDILDQRQYGKTLISFLTIRHDTNKES